MFEKISLGRVVREHLGTLTDYRQSAQDQEQIVGQTSGATSQSDLALFYLAPSCLGVVAALSGCVVTDSLASATITAFSIFAGLLFNVLGLVFELQRRNLSEPHRHHFSDANRRAGLREIQANVSYCILVAVLCILLALLSYLITAAWAQNLIAAMLTVLVSNFILTLLMVLKRMHALLASP